MEGMRGDVLFGGHSRLGVFKGWGDGWGGRMSNLRTCGVLGQILRLLGIGYSSISSLCSPSNPPASLPRVLLIIAGRKTNDVLHH